MAILTKKTHALGANIGIIVGVFFNMYLWLNVPNVFWFWWNAIGCVVTMVVAYTFSLIIKKKSKKGIKFLFYREGKKELIILIGYFVVIVVFSMSLFKILG